MNSCVDIPKFFGEIGREIHDTWREREFAEDAFSAIAMDTCVRFFSSPSWGYGDILEWLASTIVIPFQRRSDETFGQPSVTLFWSDRFLIEALFWHTATTAVHQHAFCGAFAVLEGSSVHTVYEFSPRKRVNSQIAVGSTRVLLTELLRKGDVRRIGRGTELVHSLFHLEIPSVTIVVRTCRDAEVGPELVYYVPTIAIDPEAFTPLLKKRLQSLDLLTRVGEPTTEGLASKIIERCDFFTAFQVLLRLRLGFSNTGPYERVLSQVQSRFPEYVNEADVAVEEQRRTTLISELRRTISSSEHRFFLALLLNLSKQSVIFEMIRQAFPKCDPPKQVHKWILEIATDVPIGIRFDRSSGILLQWMLSGASKDEVQKRAMSLSDPGGQSQEAANAGLAFERIATHAILRPLFSRVDTP